jgi:hypothetical protein
MGRPWHATSVPCVRLSMRHCAARTALRVSGRTTNRREPRFFGWSEADRLATIWSEAREPTTSSQANLEGSRNHGRRRCDGLSNCARDRRRPRRAVTEWRGMDAGRASYGVLGRALSCFRCASSFCFFTWFP